MTEDESLCKYKLGLAYYTKKSGRRPQWSMTSVVRYRLQTYSKEFKITVCKVAIKPSAIHLEVHTDGSEERNLELLFDKQVKDNDVKQL